MTGYLKRTSMKESPEEIVLLRALRDMNHPKFIYDDTILFQALLTDLFPNIVCPSVQHPDLRQMIEEVLLKQKYTVVQAQIEKIIQLYETMMTRHSTMVIGPTR